MYTHMDSLALIIFVVSEKKAFEHFPETTNMIKAKLSICVYIGWSSINFTFFVPI
jgi:hypothetical protein